MLERSLVALAILSAACSATARDCDKGETLYEQGLAAGRAGNMAAAEVKLEQSLFECESYESAYLLGQARQELEDWDGAESAFEMAARLASNNNATALALGRLAELKNSQGDSTEALALVLEARELHTAEPSWMTDLALELDSAMAERPLEIAQVTRALELPKRAFHIVDKPPASNPAGGSTGNAGPTSSNPYANNSSINVRINFEFDSTKVDSISRGNVQVLADALSQSNFDGKQFVLVGHTDVRGDWGYNQQLSEQRARAIQQELLSRRPELRGRLRTEGAGEARPLYNGQSEREHNLNRRLEVVVAS
ncbi:MAG: OmpA family protein [Pseudomonadota bacterium]